MHAATINISRGQIIRARSKIAFGHYSSADDVGGVTSWLGRFLPRLCRDGHEIIVLLHHFGDEVNQSSILQPLLDAGIKVDIRPRSTFSGDVRNTLEFLNRHRPLVFLPQCLGAMYLAAGLAGRQGLPWAMTLHSDDPEYWAIADTVRPERSGGVVVGVSEQISRVALEEGISTVPRTIPYGVPTPSTSATFSQAPFRVAFSGRLIEDQKRMSLVTTAMVEACYLDKRVECVVLGDGPSRGEAMQRVSDCNLSMRIRFPGRISPTEVQAELGKCQALLLMSDFEGLPLALLEAMALGVVPVARMIPSGIPELVLDGHTGILVDEEPKSAAAAILKLANDRALWTKCSLGAKKLVQDHFSEDSSYAKWMALLDLLCRRSSIRYPIRVRRGLDLRIRLQEFARPLIAQQYPKPESLRNVVKKRLGTAAREAKRLVQSS